MAINWNNPTNGSQYNVVLDELKAMIYKGVTLNIDSGTDSNIPDGAIRWSDANSRFEKFSLSSGVWSELASIYAISVGRLQGKLDTDLTAAENMTGAFIPENHINDLSHGDRGNGTLHMVATPVAAGFMSSADKTKLDAATNLSDTGVEEAYNRQVLVASEFDSASPTIKRFSPYILGTVMISKLSSGLGIKSIIFDKNNIIKFGTTTPVNVDNGQYQNLTLTGNTTLDFTAKPGHPYTMYLYLTTNGHTVSLPAGKWPKGTVSTINTGLCLLTVNYDGSSYYYMALLDMK